jgi:outer membrane lipoprotein-sorting protein
MLRFTVALLALRAFAQSPDPVVIAKQVASALGWTAKFDTVISLQVEGTLDGTPITVFAKQPSLFRMNLGQGQTRIVQAYDGSFGWQSTDGEGAKGATQLTGAQLNQLFDQASNAIGGPLVQAPERGTHLEYEGRETVDGKDCYKLKLTLVSGSVIHSYIDATDYLEIREELVSGSNQNVIEESVGDYRIFGGIQFPCRFVSHKKGDTQTHELKIDKVTINPTLPAGLFAMPIQ